jgi:hypothetical protein
VKLTGGRFRVEGRGLRGLRSIRHAQLPEDVIDVTLYGRFADAERIRNLLVGLTFHNLLKDLQLSYGQF